jgi:hypothetical protein
MGISKEEFQEYLARREGRQSQADEGRYTKEMHEEYARAQQEQQEKEAEESRKRLARAAYKAAGGKDTEFEKEWAELDRQERHTRLQEAARNAHLAQSASRVSRI